MRASLAMLLFAVVCASGACSKSTAIDSSKLTAVDATRAEADLAPGAAPDAGPPCAVDTDCRLVDDYCTGCDCRVLRKSDPDPTCAGPGVRCFAQPCSNHLALCVRGTCVLGPKPQPMP
jgi:hypothetical protein